MRAITKAEMESATKEWIELALLSFPSQSRHFLQVEKDQFRNPIGNTLQENIPVLLEELVGGKDQARLSAALEDIVRIHAVQGTPPSEALAFLFQAPRVLRHVWKGSAEGQDEALQWTQQAVLLAFDLYMECREKIYAVQVEETRRRVAQLERVYQESYIGPGDTL